MTENVCAIFFNVTFIIYLFIGIQDTEFNFFPLDYVIFLVKISDKFLETY